ncbi:hypothetical protein [Aquabacterium sp.]|nr:hypothetical protein [Aquabacterium sp.]MBC7699810.1 hypothetical protein [Aquabacterium sp.]
MAVTLQLFPVARQMAQILYAEGGIQVIKAALELVCGRPTKATRTLWF